MTVTPSYTPDDQTILGLVVTHDSIDLGDLVDFGITINVTKEASYSPRTGIRQKAKEITTLVEMNYVMTSRQVLNAAVRNLWAGSEDGSLTFAGREGELDISMPSGEPGVPGLNINHPRAVMSGTGFAGTPGENFAGFVLGASALIAAGADALGQITQVAAPTGLEVRRAAFAGTTTTELAEKGYDVTEHSIPQVQSAVTTGLINPKVALEQEEGNTKPRPTLIAWLKSVKVDEPQEPLEPGQEADETETSEGQ